MVCLGKAETVGGGADPVVAVLELIREIGVQDDKEEPCKYWKWA